MADTRLLDAYWRQMARVGAEVSAQSLSNWSRLNPVSLEATGAGWLALMLSVIRGERRRTRAVAASFYRLHRAIETGYTVPPLGGDYVGDTTTLGDLRGDWARQTGTIHVPLADDAQGVIVEGFDWPEEPEEGHERASTVSMVSQGLAPVYQELSQEDGDRGRGRLDDPDFLSELNDSIETAGNRAAMAADREAQRGGRDLIRRASQADQRVLGWARVTDGDPCGFCAMLASRGAVYRTRAHAGIRGLGSEGLPEVHRDDLEKYHNGCHCQTVPIYSRDEFLTDQARDYANQWREVTRGTEGDEARRAWRRHIDAQRRNSR